LGWLQWSLTGTAAAQDSQQAHRGPGTNGTEIPEHISAGCIDIGQDIKIDRRAINRIDDGSGK
jgi:hypothetical protein